MNLLKNNKQLFILLILVLGLNANTLWNQYAVDDEIVMLGNTYVQKGILGIPDILSHDFFSGVKGIDQIGLSGGRYRPFALVVFAFEYQLFGANPFVSHLINILLFALLITLLFHLLKNYIFKEQHYLFAFITCLLFVVHPIHTEVVANVKSRDELLSFILILVSLLAVIRNIEKRSIAFLISGLVCFFLALLTRETAVTFIVILPMLLFYFLKQNIKKSILYTLPLVAVFIVYLFIRFSVIGFKTYSIETDVLNDPYLFATASQAFATKIFVLLKYLILLFIPHPLSSDYSFNQIPYVNVFSIQFILSVIVLTALLIIAAIQFKKKTILSFSVFYFLITIFLVANFVVNIGAPLAERLLFQPSLAFCLVMASGYILLQFRLRWLANSLLVTLLILFSVKTIIRNREWKNNETLYLADVISAPNSVRTNLYAGKQYINKAQHENDIQLKYQYLDNAIQCDKKLLEIYPHYQDVDVYEDLGLAYYCKLDYFTAGDYWAQAFRTDPNMQGSIEAVSNLLFDEGNKQYNAGNINEAIRHYKKAAEVNMNNAEAWYRLGGNYFLMNDTKNAFEAWQMVARINPQHPFNKDEFKKITTP